MKIVVDLFNQHSGDLTELKRMALLAWLNGADAVKIQLLNSQRIWGDNSRKYLEMSYFDFKDFVSFCNKHYIEVMVTPFDEEKVEWMLDLRIKTFKVASITVQQDLELVKKILNVSDDVIISTGKLEVGEFPFGHDGVKYLYCVAEYPTDDDHERLKHMSFGKNGYYGFSDHTIGLDWAFKSYNERSQMLEKHFTFNTNFQCDTEKAHICSFTPESLKQFKTAIRMKII